MSLALQPHHPRPRYRALAAAAMGLVLIVGAAGVAHADRHEDELRARTHFAAGEYKQALDIYARLYVETLHPTYLRNIGRCHQNLGDPDKAISSFREYLRKAKDLSPDQRKEIDGYIAEMEQLKKSRAEPPPPAAPPPPPAPEPAAPTPPAMPAPTATVPSAAPSAGEPPLQLVGPAAEVERTHTDESPPITSRWWFWAGVGGVVAAGILTAVLLGRDTSPTHGNLGALDLTDKP